MSETEKLLETKKNMEKEIHDYQKKIVELNKSDLETLHIRVNYKVIDEDVAETPKKASDKPSFAWKVADIKTYLDANEIAYSPKAKKKQLLELV